MKQELNVFSVSVFFSNSFYFNGKPLKNNLNAISSSFVFYLIFRDYLFPST